MGGGASALLDAASELKLSHEQRKRYRGMYMELAKTGKTPKQIMAILSARIDEEKITGVPAMLPGKSVESGAQAKERRGSNPKKVASMPALNSYSAATLALSTDTAEPTISITVEAYSQSPGNGSADGSLKLLGSSKLSDKCTVDVEVENILDTLLDGIDDTTAGCECKLCKVPFDTAAQLKRHINFSQLHAGNARDYIANRESIIKMKRLGKVVDIASQLFLEALREVTERRAKSTAHQFRWWSTCQKVIRQLRAQDTVKHLIDLYKLDPGRVPIDPHQVLYEGTKLFWRTQETLDMHMYLHYDHHTRACTSGGVGVIQVSGYNRQAKKEVERLFISYEAVRQLIEAQLITEKEKKEAADREKGLVTGRRKSLNSLPEPVTVTHDMIVEYIQSRLEVAVMPSNVSKQRLILATSAAGVVNVSPYSTLNLNHVLGIGNGSNLKQSNPMFRQSMKGLFGSTGKAPSFRAAKSNRKLAVQQKDDPDDQQGDNSAAAIAASAESQAHKLLSIVIAPHEAIKLKQVEMPMVAIARTLSGKARAIHSTIADLDLQKRELKLATSEAEQMSAVVAEQLAPFIASPHGTEKKKPKSPAKAYVLKKGGISLETISSALHRKRRNSIG
jgi:hypothetical protein